jgi:hypothetical protein
VPSVRYALFGLLQVYRKQQEIQQREAMALPSVLFALFDFILLSWNSSGRTLTDLAVMITVRSEEGCIVGQTKYS